jgi:hypothetical protein
MRSSPAISVVWRVCRRLPYARLKRAAAMLVVGVCKVAVLVAMFEASAQVLEPSAEAEECAQEDMANPLPGAPVRSVSPKQPPLRHVRRVLDGEHDGRPANAVTVAPAPGHRLSNGLCAPLRC